MSIITYLDRKYKSICCLLPNFIYSLVQFDMINFNHLGKFFSPHIHSIPTVLLLRWLHKRICSYMLSGA